MAASKPLPEMDLYALLGLRPEAGPKEIKKAYRQKALTCHPDKHPDNPRAAELFHQLSQALAVLTDAAARAAYDQLRRAREAAARRTQRLDAQRKRVKLDLEAREAQSRGGADEEQEEAQSARALEEQVLRLREEGSRQLEEQQRLMREQLLKERRGEETGGGATREGARPAAPEGAKLKLKWKCRKHDEQQGGYSHAALLALLGKYGEVLALVMSSKKRGRAVAEFAEVKAAELALKNETGLVSNPLKLSWLDGPPPPKVAQAGPDVPNHGEAVRPGSVRSERDYESLVMMRMRQAAERQALIDRLKQEDEEDGET